MSASCRQCLAVVLTTSMFALSARADDDEQSVALSDVPQSVKDAAIKAVSGLKLESATVEAVLVFEIEGESGNTEHEIEVTGEGHVISSETEGDDDKAENEDTKSDDKDDDADQPDAKDETEESDAEHEISIPLSAVPKAALDAAEKAVASLKAEEAAVESVLIYEFVGAAGGKRYEVEVTAEGDVIEAETAD